VRALAPVHKARLPTATTAWLIMRYSDDQAGAERHAAVQGHNKAMADDSEVVAEGLPGAARPSTC